jgi:hypothetical protein
VPAIGVARPAASLPELPARDVRHEGHRHDVELRRAFLEIVHEDNREAVRGMLADIAELPLTRTAGLPSYPDGPAEDQSCDLALPGRTRRCQHRPLVPALLLGRRHSHVHRPPLCLPAWLGAMPRLWNQVLTCGNAGMRANGDSNS